MPLLPPLVPRYAAALKPADGAYSDPLLKKAARLTKVAKVLAGVDLQSIANTYQQESGGSSLEAASVATAALNAALRSALGGGQDGEGAANAEREVRNLAKRQKRAQRTEAWRVARSAEDGPEAQLERLEAHRALKERAVKAVEEKAERLGDDAVARRAVREERLMAAASRRHLSEARARFDAGRSRHRLPPCSASSVDLSPEVAAMLADDPALKRAKLLLGGAAAVVAQLEEQDAILTGKLRGELAKPPAQPLPGRSGAPPRPPALSSGPSANVAAHKSRFHAAHASASASVDDALIARAQELLADYKPTNQRKASTPRAGGGSGTASPSHGRSPSSRAQRPSPNPKVSLDVCQRNDRLPAIR